MALKYTVIAIALCVSLVSVSWASVERGQELENQEFVDQAQAEIGDLSLQRRKRDTLGLALYERSVTSAASVQATAVAFAQRIPEQAASTAVYLSNWSNQTLTFVRYYEPGKDRYRDELPPTVFAGQKAGFLISTLEGDRALQAGAVWAIEERPNLHLIAFWGAYKNSENYLAISIGDLELDSQLNDVDRTQKESLKPYCEKMNDVVASGSIETIKHCKEEFCVVGSMGGAQQTNVNIRFVPNDYNFLAFGLRGTVGKQEDLTKALLIPNAKNSRCNAANLASISFSLFLFLQSAFVFKVCC